MTNASPPRAVLDLRRHLAYVQDLTGLAALASWDAQVNMPPGGATSRANQLSAVRRAILDAFRSPDTERLLDAAEQAAPDDEAVQAIARIARRDLALLRRLPADFLEEETHAGVVAQHAWRDAKKTNDFHAFRPHLERRFELARRRADLLGFDEHPYDPLLFGYEPGVSTRDVQRVFAALRAELVPLVRAVTARGDVADPGILTRGYDVETQREFALAVAQALGFDLARGREDAAAHPFCSGVSPDDARITSRLTRENLMPLIATWHEAGHGMHHQGVSDAYRRTPLEYGAQTGPRPLGLGESQSKIWDGPVGRSRGFWTYWFPKLQALFPQQLGNVSPSEFYAAFNRVKPGIVRVDADQLTYDLHIMLRTELEIALVEGTLSVAELPDAWNARMQEYLGVTPPDVASGVLQDPHWSNSTGYFPTYTLGNVISLQLYEQADRDLGGLEDAFACGEFLPLRAWLREHVHQHGRALTSDEILTRATGRGLDAGPYVRYLKRKFGKLYGLTDDATTP